MKRLILLLVFVLLSFPAIAENFTVRCIGVTDGDTITILQPGTPPRQVKIRLDGIDAPESSQAFGTAAKQALSGLVFGKDVIVQASGKDRYGRTLATIHLPNGWNVNATLVRNGYAWHYKQYSKDPQLAQCEVQARAERKGLWSDKAPAAPWDFRRGRATIPALQTAAAAGNTTEALALLEAGTLPIDSPVNPEGWSALRLAVATRDLSAAQALLAAGANPNHRARDGSTALHSAALAPTAYVTLLLAAGADRSISDRHGVTPMQEADRAGRAAALDLLRKYQPTISLEMRQRLAQSALRQANATPTPTPVSRTPVYAPSYGATQSHSSFTAGACRSGGSHVPGKTDRNGHLHCANCGQFM